MIQFCFKNLLSPLSRKVHVRNASIIILASLPSALGAQSVSFSTAEGYSSGNLGTHPDWLTRNGVNMNAAQGRAVLTSGGFAEAIFGNPQPVITNDIYTTQIEFTFIAGNQNSVNNTPFRDVLNASFYGFNDTAGSRLKLSINRNTNAYTISLQDEPLLNQSELDFTDTGSVSSNAVLPSALGINRNSDLQSDLLRLRMTAIRGATENDWEVTGELFNNLNSGGTLIASVNLSGVTFPTSNNLRAGFGSAQSDSNAGFSNRFIESFSFERENRSPVPTPTSSGVVLGSLDVNRNGIADLAELTSPQIAQLPTTEDSDGDGVSNITEASSGTDPFDANSYLRSRNFSRATLASGDTVDFTFTSTPGVRYRIEHSNSLEASDWTRLRSVNANGTETTVTIPLTGLDLERCFFRASVARALDSDSDGLEDNIELYLGFDPNNANSVNSAAAGGDFAQFTRLFNGASANGGEFNGSSAGVPSAEQTSRFLTQAAFGPSEDLIDSIRALGDNAFSTWIDDQVNTPATLMEPYRRLLENRGEADARGLSSFVNPNVRYYGTRFGDVETRNAETAWMRQALFAPDKLRQRVAWVLAQILVASSENTRHGSAQMRYYDLLIEHALGNYEDLLYEVSVNPLMGRYLSSLGNRRADPSEGRFPDENYAREIMQLFSIGLWELNLDGTMILDSSGNPIPTYSNEDIVQVARVFTGLDFSRGGDFPLRLAAHPMQMREDRHDQGGAVSVSVYGSGEKEFLQSFRYTPDPLPVFGRSSRSGLDDIRDTVSILFNHPNCAPFISRNMIQHLVTSNPTPAYVRRVAEVFENDGTGTRGNLAAVTKAILLDEEARSLSFQLANTPGRLKAPMLRLTSLATAFEAGVDNPSLHDLDGVQFYQHPDPNDRAFESFLEYPFNHPSVFNFYEPGYAHPGTIRSSGLLSPEFQILNSLTAVNMPNQFYGFIDDRFHTRTNAGTPRFAINTDDYISDARDNPERLVDRLNLLLCHGRLSARTRTIILDSLQRLSSSTNNRRKVEHAIYLMMTSPDGALLR